MLNHWGAVLDNFDPRIVDGIAATRPVIAFNYRGVGASGGKAALTVAEMAEDAIAFSRALGFEQVDLLGFSLDGFVARDIVLKEPDLILVANGDQDKMVPSGNSIDLARRLPNAELVLYEDAGHGGIFQYHEAFVRKALAFLEA